MIRSERVRVFLKWGLYALVAFFCYMYMTTSVGTMIKPLLLVPAAICISMWENELLSALTGIVCGLMLDAACGKVMGYNAFLLMIVCMFTSLLFLYLMRQNIINCIFVTTGATLLLSALDFFFYYGIWGYEQVELLLWRNTLPAMLFTVLSCGILYFVVKFIYVRLSLQAEPHIEEKSDSIVRE